MHDAVIVTLSILIVVMLRRSLLTDPGASGAWADGEDSGYPVLVPARVPTERPHSVRQAEDK